MCEFWNADLPMFSMAVPKFTCVRLVVLWKVSSGRVVIVSELLFGKVTFCNEAQLLKTPVPIDCMVDGIVISPSPVL